MRPPPLVTVAKVTVRDVPVEARAPVDLRPLAQADIGSKTLGYLDAVLVDRGDPVRRGQLLAIVRPSDLPDQLAAARGTLAQNQASLALARANLERAKQLAPSGLVSQQELQQTTAAVASAEAQRQAIESQVAALATRLGETRIASPLDGFVWQRRLDPGALVGQAGSAGVILTLVKTDVLRAFLPLPERQAGSVRVGQSAWFELDALAGRRFEGRVVRVSPVLDPSTRTLEAEVRLPNPKGELRPGMYGRGAIVLDVHPAAVTAPIEAVLVSEGRRYAFVLDGEVVRRRPIETGVDGGDWMEVVRGLKPGDEVVTAGADGLAEGSKVRVMRGVDPYTGKRLDGAGKDSGQAGQTQKTGQPGQAVQPEQGGLAGQAGQAVQPSQSGQAGQAGKPGQAEKDGR